MELREEHGYARVTDVAKALNITTGSASTNLKNLKLKGLVQEDTNRFLELSERGMQLSKAVKARRSIFKKFLVDFLKVDPAQAEIDACKTEHLLSHETSERLMSFMQRIAGKGLTSKKLVICKTHDPENCQICDEECLLADC